MAPQSTNNQTNSFEPMKSTAEVGADRSTTTRLTIRIPKNLHEQPVISRLVSHHGVTVNITAALLGANGGDDGWFDLEIQGRGSQIQSALTYLNELDLDIWTKSTAEQDGW